MTPLGRAAGGAGGAAPRVGPLHRLPRDEATQSLLDARRARHVELHVAERLGARALEAAVEAAQRVLEVAAEELLRREPELGQRLEEHAAELLRVVLSEGVRLAPAKRGGERARRQRVPRAQLKLGKEPAELQRHAAVLGAVQHRVVLEEVEALAQLRADVEALHERVEVAGCALVCQADVELALGPCKVPVSAAPGGLGGLLGLLEQLALRDELVDRLHGHGELSAGAARECQHGAPSVTSQRCCTSHSYLITRRSTLIVTQHVSRGAMG